MPDLTMRKRRVVPSSGRPVTSFVLLTHGYEGAMSGMLTKRYLDVDSSYMYKSQPDTAVDAM